MYKTYKYILCLSSILLLFFMLLHNDCRDMVVLPGVSSCDLTSPNLSIVPTNKRPTEMKGREPPILEWLRFKIIHSHLDIQTCLYFFCVLLQQTNTLSYNDTQRDLDVQTFGGVKNDSKQNKQNKIRLFSFSISRTDIPGDIVFRGWTLRMDPKTLQSDMCLQEPY